MPDSDLNNLSAEAPSFPPLLTGYPTELQENPREIASAKASAHEAGAGDLFWSPAEDRLKFALVLEPEVLKERCYEMVYLAMVAFGDAAGALMPPEVAITYAWPSSLLVNEGEVGYVDLLISDSESDTGVPDWLVLSMDIELRPAKILADPGKTYHRTTFWDEGCGHVSRTELLDSVARHFLTWLHNWDEDGFRAIYNQWMQRLNAKQDVSILYDGGTLTGDFIDLEETGNAFLRSDDKTTVLQTQIALHDKRAFEAARK